MNIFINKKNIRKSFNKHNQIIKLPNLLDIQKESYYNFIYGNENYNSGIDKVFKSIFPIFNYNKNIKIEYINYSLKKCKFNSYECKIKGLTYFISIKALLKITFYDKNSEITNKIEQNVYIGDLPLMTENSSFIINGIEKVIVSQLHRSPGVFFDLVKDKNNLQNKKIYNARIIPYRGSWIDFELDYKNCLFVRIDRKKKIPIITFFLSLNIPHIEIIDIFSEKINIVFKENNFYIKVNECLYNKKFNFEIKINDKNIIESNTVLNENHINLIIDNNINLIKIDHEYLIEKILLDKIYNDSGNLLFNYNTKIDIKFIDKIKKIKNIEFNILDNNNLFYGKYILNTLKIDNTDNYKKSIYNICKFIKTSDFSSFESLEYFFKSIFLSEDKYDLSKIGRLKINQSINNFDNNSKLLNKLDFIRIIKKLINIKNNLEKIDDIDNLSNRRIKCVGEMIENQFRLGLLRIEKNVKDKLSIGGINLSNITPKKIISSKQLSSVIKEFFNSSQLSQFMDQNNPLAEITHKRRISALGPGGLTRERAGFEVRDVHSTHYGKLCPIETPEGPNIGLISSLSIYSKVDEYGFLKTPYQLVKNGVVTNEIIYLTSYEEYNFIIAQSNSKLDLNNKFINKYIMCRHKGEFNLFKYDLINYIDSSCQQIVSVGSSLIPFLEHNDANRALMGANMQRQAVPLITSDSPLVGTGMELRISKDSKASIFAKRSGTVCYLDYKCIIIKIDNKNNKNDFKLNEDLVDVYDLKKFTKSNQNTCINYKPCVNLNEYVNKGDVISDSQSTDFGELSLGKNIRVAFMSWYGYNFEDSMIISEKLVENNTFTSLHIQEFVCILRDTKLGKEEITSDVPNISEYYLKKLDESGIITLGSYVNQGDILVGKITPKSETQLTPEEKLLRAIFGEKASNVKDTSLRVPNGVSGKVIDIQIFTKDGIKKNNRSIIIESNKLKEIYEELNNEKNIIKSIIFEKIKSELKKNNIDNLGDNFLNSDYKKHKNLDKNLKTLLEKYNNIEKDYQDKINLYKNKINKFDELPQGILKIVKVYIATKKYIQPGDKMAGRHGNKGVISKINPIEDMPYDSNGNTIDIILNPLGVPSRMNIGQILETHLGLALHNVGNHINNMIKNNIGINKIRFFLDKLYNMDCIDSKKINFDNFTDKEIIVLSENLKNGLNISTPVFDGINEKEIKNILKITETTESGKMELYDGITGEKFDRKITVGYIYMMKLNHLVDDKIHARSTGSYSLITQQPLGGKAQFGGQRFGEMEVWALEAYGAAYTLQEMLTVKSDDVDGRTNMYKNIINGNYNIETNIPESFNVLIKEIRSLCINIELDEID